MNIKNLHEIESKIKPVFKKANPRLPEIGEDKFEASIIFLSYV